MTRASDFSAAMPVALGVECLLLAIAWGLLPGLRQS